MKIQITHSSLKKLLLSIITFIGILAYTVAQDLSGSWTGLLEVPGQEPLPLIFYLENEDDQWKGTVDNPDQNAVDIPITSIEIDHPNLELEVEHGVIQSSALHEPLNVKKNKGEGSKYRGFTKFGTLI